MINDLESLGARIRREIRVYMNTKKHEGLFPYMQARCNELKRDVLVIQRAISRIKRFMKQLPEKDRISAHAHLNRALQQHPYLDGALVNYQTMEARFREWENRKQKNKEVGTR